MRPEKEQTIPKATYSFIRALLHLFRSPPLPQPISSTLPRRPPRPPPPSATVLAARTGCAKRVIKTDFIQLLKLRIPIIRETRLWSMPTSGRALSDQLAKLGQSFRQGGRQRTMIHDKPSIARFFGDGWIIIR